MKSIWLRICVIAAVVSLCLTEAKPDEPSKTQTPATEPMIGKEPGQVRDDNGLKMKLVWCPRGFVTMENVKIVTEPAVENTAENVNVHQQPDDDVDPKTNDKAGLISDFTHSVIMRHAEQLDSAIIYDRDYDFDYFGFKEKPIYIGEEVQLRWGSRYARGAKIECSDPDTSIRARLCFPRLPRTPAQARET